MQKHPNMSSPGVPLAPLLLKRIHSLAEAAAVLGVLFTLAGLLGRYAWFLELFTHFKLQLAVCFLGYAVLELAARRHRRAAVSLACAAINAWPVFFLFLPASLGTGAILPLKDSAHIRILHANLLTSNTNSPALLALVACEQPDVIVLHETDGRWLRDLAPLTNSYPVFATLPRDDNFGAAIYCNSKALSSDIFLLNDPEGLPSSHAHIAVGGRTLTVIGVHPLAPYTGYLWRGRNGFTRELAQTLKAVDSPLVVTGDFNNTPWTATFRAFLKASGLRDSSQGRGPLPTWPAANPLLRIPLDHCFHSSSVRILSKRAGPDIGSDHLPLLIDVAF
ncbi:MAG: endonuclease/exonuclease/phosphatase family protein [bacterium]